MNRLSPVPRPTAPRPGIGRLGLLSGVLVLAACATPAPSCPTVEPTPVAVVEPAPVVDERSGATDLAEAIRLYDSADYPAVIQKLQSSGRLWQDIPEVQVSAYKYLAFSYCATGRRQPCRRAFQSLLKMQPDFQLGRTEVGHPIWGPEFAQARREAGLAPAQTSAMPVKVRARPGRQPARP